MNNDKICIAGLNCQAGYATANKWYQNIDITKLNGVVFLNLKKAFDTVAHGILLDKIRSYGIKRSAHSWLTSYLLNRT